ASSVRFGVALGRLAAAGQLVAVSGPATGAWSYNGQVMYWARPPRPTRLKSWVEHCAAVGRSPDWQEEDRQGLPRGP
ncbi:MAG: hypothetical protein M3P93_16265, partial [Actinomycetota bacterium]|nr:hypothetical protein [Actinomycetota bacterium]